MMPMAGGIDKTQGPGGRWPGRRVRIADGSCISKPGGTGTDWRLSAATASAILAKVRRGKQTLE